MAIPTTSICLPSAMYDMEAGGWRLEPGHGWGLSADTPWGSGSGGTEQTALCHVHWRLPSPTATPIHQATISILFSVFFLSCSAFLSLVHPHFPSLSLSLIPPLCSLIYVECRGMELNLHNSWRWVQSDIWPPMLGQRSRGDIKRSSGANQMTAKEWEGTKQGR